MPRRSLRLVGIVVTVAVIAATVGLFWKRHDVARSLERAALPPAAPYHEAIVSRLPVSPSPSASAIASPQPTKKAGPAVAALPAEINLAVPFTVQAPHGTWDPPYKEFCEEASVLMAASYLRNEDIPSPEFADQKMLEIKGFENKRFGYYQDTTVAETAVILKEYYQINHVELVEDPSVNDLKEAVAAGRLVIVPAAGRLLGNPYYTPPGPLYHMVVIKGYTAGGKFITNDPGTRRGADFLFDEQVVMNAIHDWRSDGHIDQGRKVALIVG